MSFEVPSNSFFEKIQSHLGKIVSALPVSGGDINSSYKIKLKTGEVYFAKTNSNPPKDFFIKEAHGLELLEKHSSFVIPKVKFVCQNGLVIDWLEPLKWNSKGWQEFGIKLSELHQVTHSKFGLDEDNFIGILVQRNKFEDEFTEFWVKRRLQPLVEKAKDRELLNKSQSDEFYLLFDKIRSKKVETSDERPALLHGDLWSGNCFLTSQGPALVDPAVYFGNREVELSFTQLFGGFSEEFYKSYKKHLPMSPSFQKNMKLWQLYPLLVHLNLFGTSYQSSVINAVRIYL